MDVSKLPRLSNTDPAPKAVEPIAGQAQPEPAVDHRAWTAAPPQSTPADVWISLAVGVIMLLMYPRFLQWVSSRLFHTNFNPFLKPDGTAVPYTQVPEFWADLGPTLFGLVLVVEGIALLAARRRSVMVAAFALTVLATGYNLAYLIVSFRTYGLALVSALAVAFGVYIAMYQWRLIQDSKSFNPHPDPLPSKERE